MEVCPCGSNKNYDVCCGQFLDQGQKAPTAEALMRSRYVAFTKANIPYLFETCAPEARTDFDEKATRHWASKSDWKGLKVLRTDRGQVGDDRGLVEFTAAFSLEGQDHLHHEIADFKKSADDGRWYFVDGNPPKLQPVTRVGDKIGRNDPCSCGSGKKFKKCHGS